MLTSYAVSNSLWASTFLRSIVSDFDASLDELVCVPLLLSFVSTPFRKKIKVKKIRNEKKLKLLKSKNYKTRKAQKTRKKNY